MKKNKKGFILAETIFVIATLTTSLIISYYAFTTVINNQKKRYNYNDAAYIYRTYYILDFLNSRGLNSYMDYYLNDKLIYTDPCSDTDFFPSQGIYPDSAEEMLCDTIINDAVYNVNNLYVTAFNVNPILDCYEDSSGVGCERVPKLSMQLVSYLKTEKGNTADGSSKYRIIIEYKKGKTYNYASLGFK